MKKNVIISINSAPRYDDEQNPEKIELITDGKYYRKNGIYYIIYEESPLTGMEGITTTLKVEPTKVTLIRNGEFPSQMIFECGEKHVGLYNVAEGSLTVSINASKIRNTLTDDGGELEIAYSIEVNNSLIGENLFTARVKEADVAV